MLFQICCCYQVASAATSIGHPNYLFSSKNLQINTTSSFVPGDGRDSQMELLQVIQKIVTTADQNSGRKEQYVRSKISPDCNPNKQTLSLGILLFFIGVGVGICIHMFYKVPPYKNDSLF